MEHEERMRKYQIEEKHQEEMRRRRQKEREELRQRTSSYIPSSRSTYRNSEHRLAGTGGRSSYSSPSNSPVTSSIRTRERERESPIVPPRARRSAELPLNVQERVLRDLSGSQERSNIPVQREEESPPVAGAVVAIEDLPLPFPVQPSVEEPVSVQQFLLPKSEDCSKYCPILCRETENWVQTPCGHYFDEEAITTWLTQPNGLDSCPVCRKAFRVFDKRAQHELALNLGLSYINNIASQYNTLWATDRSIILQRFWDDIPPEEIRRLSREFRRPNSAANISHELDKLLEIPILEYCEKLHKAIYSIVLKDIKLNLKYHIPLCYQSQLDKDIILYIAYCLTTVVPAFYLKWWKRVYVGLIREGLEEKFLQENI
jgi:hypothetical protein